MYLRGSVLCSVMYIVYCILYIHVWWVVGGTGGGGGGGGITMLCGIVRVQVDTGFVTIIITSVVV